jgi:serine protease Do
MRVSTCPLDSWTSSRWINGQFTFPQQLPKGQAYGLIVVARGYRDLAIESALRVSAHAPEHAQLNPIPLQRE